MTSESPMKTPNLFALEMQWMTGNRADLSFKNENNTVVYKIKRLINALGFVGLLVQLSTALGLCNYQMNVLYLRNNNKDNNWQIRYCLIQGVVEWSLIFKNGFAQAEKVIFSWAGAFRDFRASVDRFIKHLPPYPFFGMNALAWEPMKA